MRSLLHGMTRERISKMLFSVMDKASEAIAVSLLDSGGVIALPTDTVYGLACDATNVDSINRLYEIKCRDESKPVAICLGDIPDVSKWARVDHLPHNLLEALLPGPVTLVLSCANKLDKSLTFRGKVGVRIPDCGFVRHVARRLNRPLALTSANVSSEPSSLTVGEFETLWPKLSAVFDGGDLGAHGGGRRNASTVVDLSRGGCFEIVREGVAGRETGDLLRGVFGLNEI